MAAHGSSGVQVSGSRQWRLQTATCHGGGISRRRLNLGQFRRNELGSICNLIANDVNFGLTQWTHCGSGSIIIDSKYTGLLWPSPMCPSSRVHIFFLHFYNSLTFFSL